MKITLENIGKRFNSEWIFKNVNLEFEGPNGIVILGGNGSGKSTLLQVIAGNYLSSEGKITYSNNGNIIPVENIFKHLAISTPYLELFEEFTLKEAIEFHGKFKPLLLSCQEIIALAYLENSANKPIKYFSSGMKQRVRLALAILSNCPLLLLDEPTSNLDTKGIDWYQKLITDYTQNKLIFVCSNKQESEYFFCKEIINIEEFKLIKDIIKS